MRFALVFVMLVSFGAVAGSTRLPSQSSAGKPRQWKCTWRGSVVFCERIDRKPGPAARDSVFLYERTAPEFASLVAAPRSFEPVTAPRSGQ